MALKTWLVNSMMHSVLERNVSKSQTSGVKCKGVADYLSVLRGLIDHSSYLAKELRITFYDTEKRFDSLWFEDCINALWRNGIQDDTLYLVYLINRKVCITVKTSFGDTDPFIATYIFINWLSNVAME